MPETLHLAVALDGSGWHPAAWREPAAQPTALLTAVYWTDLVQTAERGLADFVTIEDSLRPTDSPVPTIGSTGCRAAWTRCSSPPGSPR
jgi:alkanesulfonate monooxygenase SsuD/methylene tetrahydromethanopterin reductase-like flavin-dependent oxidoreductase (luciferase family)